MPRLADALLGRTIGGCRIVATIGSGGMGTVYRGVQERLGAPVAVKVIRHGGEVEERMVARFAREARAIAALRGQTPHVVQVFDQGFDAETEAYFIVMEYVEGESLAGVLRRLGRLPAAAAVRVARQAAAGLQVAHRHGLVHRDVKPDNLLLTPDGCVKLADFGLVRTPDDVGRLTASGQMVGTLAYMAPEQAMGDTIDHRTDLYALGATLFTLCTGKPPQGDTSSHGGALLETLMHLVSAPVPPLRVDGAPVSATLEAIVQRLMAKRPDDRYVSAAEAAAALATWLAAEAPDAARPDADALAGLALPRPAVVMPPLLDDLGVAPTRASVTADTVPPRVPGAAQPAGNGPAASGNGSGPLAPLVAPSGMLDTPASVPTAVHRPARWTTPVAVAVGLAGLAVAIWAAGQGGPATPGPGTAAPPAPATNAPLTPATAPLPPTSTPVATSGTPTTPPATIVTPRDPPVPTPPGRDPEMGNEEKRKLEFKKSLEYAKAVLDASEGFRGPDTSPGWEDAIQLATILEGKPGQEQTDADVLLAEAWRRFESFCGLAAESEASALMALWADDPCAALALWEHAALVAFTPHAVSTAKEGRCAATVRVPPGAIHEIEDACRRDDVARGRRALHRAESALRTHLLEVRTRFRATEAIVTARADAKKGEHARARDGWARAADCLPVDHAFAKEARAGFLAAIRELGEVTIPLDADRKAMATFVRIKRGKWRLGEPDGKGAAAPRDVEFTCDYWLQTTETTRGQYRAITGADPSKAKGEFKEGEKEQLPVDSVSWKDCNEFCTRLPKSLARVWHGWHVTLPTEAEWEHACRAGTRTPWHFGAAAGEPGERAWFGRGDDGGTTHPVAKLSSNTWKLHDMHGNVWEWCADWYGADPPAGKDPTGPAAGSRRSVRGGCYGSEAPSTTSSWRQGAAPDTRFKIFGFRLCLREPKP